jgi:amino acid transporter
MGREPLEEQFEAAEREVEGHSAHLKKELRTIDLVAIQILTSVGYSWIGTAGKLGPEHVMFWLPAVLLFYVPSGIVVAHLSKEMPLEGGMYQWAKLRFGAMAGFLVALNLWLYNVLISATIGLQIIGTAPYALERASAGLASNKPVVLAVSFGLTGLLMFVAWRGLSLGKWISTAGGFATLFLFSAVIVVAVPQWFAGTAVTTPAALSFPAVTLFNLNILGKMGAGALSGIDAVAVFAGEFRSRNVAGAIRKSIWFGAPAIGLMMILGTASVLTFSRPESIDLLMPPIQVLSLGAPSLAKMASVLIILIMVAGGSLTFSVLTRFPMVAGWDHLLPEWFCRLDPRYRTPAGSIVFAGATILVFSVIANAGAGNQEAYQFLLNAALICYACAYLVMFAIPLLGPGEKPSLVVRMAALAGASMTLLFVVLSIFPIVEEQNPGMFTMRMVGILGGLQLAGILFYRRATRRQ